MNDKASNKRKFTILVIDDKLENIKLLLKVLSEAGYETLMAKDGIRGLQRAAYAKPDLILLDIMMPEISGFEVCKRLKQQEETRDIPVIFMSALQDTVDKLEGFGLGAADYITKPFYPEEVLARIKTHLQIYHLQRDLKQRNMELDTFARSVAHDLKNPLHIIINYAELLIEVEPGTPFSKNMQKNCLALARAGQKMNATINELLTLAGLSRHSIKPTVIDMAKVIEPVLQDRLALMIQQTQAKIDLPKSWPPALGYAPWLEEVWLNYLSNGLKYGGKPPHLKLGAYVQDDQVCFWVKDNGTGIDPEVQQQLFKPFTRGNNTEVHGYGLGLSIVQQIIDKLDGEIGVNNEFENGSRFYFCLPLPPETKTQIAKTTLSPPTFHLKDCCFNGVQLQHFRDFIELGDISGLGMYIEELLTTSSVKQHPCLQYLKQLLNEIQFDTLKAFFQIETHK